jgi:hypothetical protein
VFEARSLIPLAVMLSFALGYMIFLYLRSQWRTIELLVTLIAGGVLPAFVAQLGRDRLLNEEVQQLIAMFAMLMILGQLFALTGTLIGMEWIKKWKLESTFHRLAAISYGWFVLPAVFVCAGAGIGFAVEGVRNVPAAVICGISAVFLLPALRLAVGPSSSSS